MKKVNSRSLWLALLLAAALLLPTPSFAQIYVGVYGGATIPHKTDISLLNRPVDRGFGPESRGIVGDAEFDAGAVAGGRVGYWFKPLPYAGVELEGYRANAKISDLNIEGFTIPIDEEVDLDVYTVALNFLFRYPYGPIQPYGGMGMGVAYTRVDDFKFDTPVALSGEFSLIDIPAGTTFSSDDKTTMAFQLMAGLKVFITDNISLSAEYKWGLLGNDFEFKGPPGARLDFPTETSHVSVGIEFHFGPGVKKQ